MAFPIEAQRQIPAMDLIAEYERVPFMLEALIAEAQNAAVNKSEMKNTDGDTATDENKE